MVRPLAAKKPSTSLSTHLARWVFSSLLLSPKRSTGWDQQRPPVRGSGPEPPCFDPQGGNFWEREWELLGKRVGTSGKEPFRQSIENKAFSSFFGFLNTF